MINYNLVNEYVQKLIKLGVTPDNIKTTFDNYNKSYIHLLKGGYASAGEPSVNVSFAVTNNKNSAITYNDIIQLLTKLDCTSKSKLYPATGYSNGFSIGNIDPFGIVGVYVDRFNELMFVSTTGRDYVVRELDADNITEI